MYDGAGVAGTSVGEVLRMKAEGRHVVQGLIDHGREFRLSVLSATGKDCRVLGWGVR